MWWDILKLIITLVGLSFIPAAIALVFLGEKVIDHYAARAVRHPADLGESRIELTVGGGQDA